MKGDRFERVAQKETTKETTALGLLDWQEAAALLRREHRAVVRLIKKQPSSLHEVSRPTNDWISRADLLAAMAARGKYTKRRTAHEDL